MSKVDSISQILEAMEWASNSQEDVFVYTDDEVTVKACYEKDVPSDTPYVLVTSSRRIRKQLLHNFPDADSAEIEEALEEEAYAIMETLGR